MARKRGMQYIPYDYEAAEVVTRESAEETNTELLQSIDKKLDMLLAAQTATQAAKEE